MKYAYLIGTSAFIVPSKTINYGDKGNWKHFIRINSIFQESQSTELNIDLDIKDIDGTPVVIIANKPATGSPYAIKAEKDSVMLSRIDGSTIIHVHQLDWDAAMDLEHNIVAEFEVQQPDAVIRITGEFFVDLLHIRAENEKLLINDNGYATAAMVGHSDLKFTSEGVVL